MIKLPNLSSSELIEITEQFSAHNYSPLDVVIASADGSWVVDVEGKRYLDMLSAYSAVNFGHGNARIKRAAIKQIERVTLTSRAFYNDQFGPLCSELAELCGMEAVLLMNSGAEAVETAVKAARKWGYEVKGVDHDKAEIIAFSGNFHGRTTTIISFSDSESSRKNFGPFTPGFKIVTYGDIGALQNLISKNTVGILVEPIQGEGGVIIPPDGYLNQIRELCSGNNILMIADEVQSGFCRTGELFACHHEGVQPDLYVIGKSLGGGIMPVSAVVGQKSVMSVFTPGTHGSTFGGSPLACAIAREVIRIIKEDLPHKRAKVLGDKFIAELRSIKSSIIDGVRGRGLFFGVDINPSYGKAKQICYRLKEEGLLSKDTREQTIRFVPPLTISESDLELGLEKIKKVLQTP